MNEEIRVDLENVFSPPISQPYGITRDEIAKLSEHINKAHGAISSDRKQGNLGFLDIPYDPSTVNAINEIAESVSREFDNFLTIAIGGSALGSITVFNALSRPYHNLLDSARRDHKPRMFFPDNIDPDRLSGLLDILDLRRTMINVISKSGGTVETLAVFMIIKEKLLESVGRASYKKHIVITTSLSHGTLRKIAIEEGIRYLTIPDNLPGRFSVLSPSGLLCAGILGYDIDEFMAGARLMDSKTKDRDVWKNPAYLYATLHYLADTKKGLDVFVLMPYSHSLRKLADWYAQSVAESIGKKSKTLIATGPTPVKALGVTDQHSLLQLLVQGRMNKIITFIAVENFKTDLSIPKLYSDYDSIGYLGGHTLVEMLHAERKATQLSLKKNSRLNCTIYLPEINPYTLGQLFCFFEISIVFMGQLYNVNPLDQPGVEESKDYARALMGKEI